MPSAPSVWIRPASVPRTTSPSEWPSISDDTVTPEAIICAMSSTESKSLAPETTNIEPSPRFAPEMDA